MLTKRQESLLLSLSKFRYMDVSQFRRLHDLKSERNAYRVVKQIEPYTHVMNDSGTKVFYLNKKGREAVDCPKISRKLTTTRHYLMRNDLYIYLGAPGTWRNEVKVTQNNVSVIADAHFTTACLPHDKHHVVEVDNMQKMRKNRVKIEKYRRLIEYGAFDGMPEIIWVTTTKHRQDLLQDLCEGLDCKIYLREDLL